MKYQKSIEQIQKEINVNSVEYAIQKMLARIPYALPHPSSWHVPDALYNELVDKIVELFYDNEWLEDQKPVAFVMVGDSISDHNWLFQVLLVQALITMAREYRLKLK